MTISITYLGYQMQIIINVVDIYWGNVIFPKGLSN